MNIRRSLLNSEMDMLNSTGVNRTKLRMATVRWAVIAVGCFLLAACAATLNPPMTSDERRVASDMAPVTTVALLIDYRLHLSRYNYKETLKDYYDRIADQLSDRLSAHGVTVTQRIFLNKQFDTDVIPTNLQGQPTHVLHISHDSLTFNNLGVVSLNWRVTLNERKLPDSTYRPVFLTGFIYRPCMGQMPVRLVWQDCADKVAEHVVDRFTLNGIVRSK